MTSNVTTGLVNPPEEKALARLRPRRAQERQYSCWRTSALLTAEEERELAVRIKAGDTAARERLILANLRLVVKLAHCYTRSGLSLDDLIQEGSRALIRAVDCFDPQTHNTRFSTYAIHWVRRGMQLAIHASGPIIHVPARLLRLRYQFERVMDELRSEENAASAQNRSPADKSRGGLSHAAAEVTASRLNISRDRLERLRQSMIRRSSLYQKDSNGEEVSMQAIVATQRRPDCELELAESQYQLQRAIDRLSAIESLLIRYRFGLMDSTSKQRRKTARNSATTPKTTETDPLTPGRIRPYTTVSRALGISIQRVREIEHDALAKLRAVLDPGLLTSLS